jgi:hypothetical protein
MRICGLRFDPPLVFCTWTEDVGLGAAVAVHGEQEVTTDVWRTKVCVTVPDVLYEKTRPFDCVKIESARIQSKKSAEAIKPNNQESSFILPRRIRCRVRGITYGPKEDRGGRRLAQKTARVVVISNL